MPYMMGNRPFTPTNNTPKGKFSSQKQVIPDFGFVPTQMKGNHPKFNSIDLTHKGFNRSFNKKMSNKSGASSDSDSLVDGFSNLMGEQKSKFMRKSEKKKSLFNKKEHVDPDNCEDLEKFIDNLGMELYEYICSQKGSR
jgi:hypothetical protein